MQQGEIKNKKFLPNADQLLAEKIQKFWEISMIDQVEHLNIKTVKTVTSIVSIKFSSGLIPTRAREIFIQ